MKINPNYLALIKQYLVDSQNCDRHTLEDLNNNLLRNIVSVEETDFAKAIFLAREFNKIDVLQDYLRAKDAFPESGELTRFKAHRFLAELESNLTFKKQSKTIGLIKKHIEEEFPEKERLESIFSFVQAMCTMTFMKLSLKETADVFSKQNGIPKKDLVDLLETI